MDILLGKVSSYHVFIHILACASPAINASDNVVGMDLRAAYDTLFFGIIQCVIKDANTDLRSLSRRSIMPSGIFTSKI
jgi:hypothetical protein